jgi:hypothetical protein
MSGWEWDAGVGRTSPVIIRRMQVEGGFLDGLDLRFDPGLNVLIGGRGTGKSSTIELIRYCFDQPGSADEENQTRSREQALSVLQGGQVTLSIEDGENDIDISRSAMVINALFVEREARGAHVDAVRGAEQDGAVGGRCHRGSMRFAGAPR